MTWSGCDLLENSYLCGISNNSKRFSIYTNQLWFAWKFVPLWYQQQPRGQEKIQVLCCDLLENSYLCGISNNTTLNNVYSLHVVICLKIRTFVVSATTLRLESYSKCMLWFAWKFVPLWYQQQLGRKEFQHTRCCDLLENSYLCGISNNFFKKSTYPFELWFAWKFVPLWYQQQHETLHQWYLAVVICLKIRTFVVSATTNYNLKLIDKSCDLLENSYLCGISNNVTESYG